MVDVVALTSVVSSGAVALGGIWVGYRQSRLQRQHELALAYEERVWDEKSACMLQVSKAAIRLADAAWQSILAAQRMPYVAFVVTAAEVEAELSAEVARVSSYASEETRVTIEMLRVDLNDLRMPRDAIRRYVEAGGSSDHRAPEPSPGSTQMAALKELELGSVRLREGGILDPLYARAKGHEVARLAGADLRRAVI